jgi:hypothetical protein
MSLPRNRRVSAFLCADLPKAPPTNGRTVDSRHSLPETETESETLPTLDGVTAKRQALKSQLKAGLEADAQKLAASTTSAAHTVRAATTNGPVPEADDVPSELPQETADAAGSPQDLEEEAGQQGAFNEETGEINWDCPCLGGMAHGPCGDEFREAFSCFVYSKEEPKGMECIDKFKYVLSDKEKSTWIRTNVGCEQEHAKLLPRTPRYLWRRT